MSGGNREPMAESAVAAFPPALSQALSGAEVALLGQGPYDSVLDKMAVADSVSFLDMAYPQPVQIAVKLDRVDRDTTVDSAGRTVLTADRLIVYVQGDYVYLGCLWDRMTGAGSWGGGVPAKRMTWSGWGWTES